MSFDEILKKAQISEGFASHGSLLIHNVGSGDLGGRRSDYGSPVGAMIGHCNIEA